MEKPSFPSDRPVQSAKEDRLARSRFASRLAEAIYRCDANEGLVIGLSGPWGSGKSSVKNMALERLRGFGEVSPEILEFNPWQFSGQDQITLAFFRELMVKLRGADRAHDPEKTKQRAAVLAKYSSLVSVASTTLKTAGALVPLVSLLASAGDATAAALKQAGEATAARAASEVESLTDLKRNSATNSPPWSVRCSW